MGTGLCPVTPRLVGAGLAPALSFKHRATARVAPTSFYAKGPLPLQRHMDTKPR
jgi:hypothetical protein